MAKTWTAGRTSIDEAHLQALKRWIKRRKKTLAWYYHLGELIELYPDGRGYRSDWIKQLAQEAGYSADVFYKARSFAKDFSSKNVKRLATKRVSWSRVVIALSVKGRRRRMQLLVQAAREHWTKDELCFQIQDEFGNRRPGVGRSPKTPMDFGVEVSLRELLRLAAKWKDLCGGPGRDELKEVNREKGAALKALLADTVKSIKKAEKLSRALLKVLEEGRTKEDSAP